MALLQEVWLHADVSALETLLPSGRYHIVGARAAAGLRRGGLLTLVDRATGWRVTGDTFERFAASAAAWRVWEGDGLMGKGFQRVGLAGERRERLTVINTHLQAEYTTGIPRTRYVAIRRSQLEQLVRAAAAAAREGPVLVAGDFNTTPDETALHTLLTDAGWIDLTAPLRAASGGGTGGGTCIGTGAGAAEWLDYAFALTPAGTSISADASLIMNSARDVPFSDHHGLAVEVSLSQPPC